jgi:hypothetical protein
VASSKEKSRERLHLLGESLRQIGLVDRFGLSALIQKGVFSEAKIQKLINSRKEILPAGLTAKFVTKHIVATLVGEAGNHAALEAPPQLASIPAGAKYATKFQREAFRILAYVFRGSLSHGKLEQSMNDGRKRYDIKFLNAATRGFFSRLNNVAAGACGRIVMECKNYSPDPGNPEFDQLAGRLNKNRRVGFLICRKVRDRKKAIARAVDAARDEQKYMMLLEDSDLIRLFEAREEADYGVIDTLMDGKLDEISN